MKCEINFGANQVDERFLPTRRGDSDGQIPALVPCQGKVDRIKLRRLPRRRTQSVAICAVQLTVRRQRKSLARSYTKTPTAEIFGNALLARRFYGTFGNREIVTISKQAGSRELCRRR